ncbi:MAG: glycosyltransferase [Vulcanimicrobiaceae bacterium]
MKYSPLLAITLASAASWSVLLFARGNFWNAPVDAHTSEADAASAARTPPPRTPRVEAVVPARDEAVTIGASIASLVAQRYAGELFVTLVDDASTDGTGVVAQAAAFGSPERDRLRVVRARALAAPWTGKLNALETGIRHALDARGAPTYWLFTDADIQHDERNVAALVAKAEGDGLDLVSLMVRLRCESAWEALLVPAFVFFFQKLYPFAWSNAPARATAAAAGGCILLSHAALECIGGLAAIAPQLIDDCSLAAAVKKRGGRTWLGLTDRTTSIRPYASLETLWRMVKRTAFTQLGYSYPLVALSVGGLTMLYLVPPVATALGVARGDDRLTFAGALAWGAMAFAYAPTMRLYRRPPHEALRLPAAAALYMAMTVDSAVAHARGRGGAWKGRFAGGDSADR